MRIKNISVRVEPSTTHNFGKIHGFFTIYATNKYGYEKHSTIGYYAANSGEFISNTFGMTFDESGNLIYTNSSTATSIRLVGVIIGNVVS